MYSDGAAKVLSIFYSSGDLGDVGRHAVAAALEMPPSVVSKIKVLAADIDSLNQSNWKCGCGGHVITPQDRTRLELIRTDFSEDVSQHLEGVDAVISCLGNRQPFHDDQVAKVGTENIVRAMQNRRIGRIVMISSVGIGDDWPPLEWSSEGKLMAGFFRTICWLQYQDLSGAEMAVRKFGDAGQDFLIVRTVATGEKIIPEGMCHVQNKKYSDVVGINIAKMDVARFIVKEAVSPTLTRQAVVVGSHPSHQTSFSTEEHPFRQSSFPTDEEVGKSNE